MKNKFIIGIFITIIIVIIAILGFNYLYASEIDESNNNETLISENNQNNDKILENNPEIEVVQDNPISGVIVVDEDLIGDNIYSFNLYNMDNLDKDCIVAIMITQDDEIIFIEYQNVSIKSDEVLPMQKSLEIPPGDSTIQAIPECRGVS